MPKASASSSYAISEAGPKRPTRCGAAISSKAIEFLTSERSPNLLIVDISGASLPVSEIQRLADVCEPGVHVVAVGDRADGSVSSAIYMHVGVSDYIVKPLTYELVSKAVQIAIRHHRRQSDQPEARQAGHRDGNARARVGATTVAVNLAWHLSNRMESAGGARRSRSAVRRLRPDARRQIDHRPAPGCSTIPRASTTSSSPRDRARMARISSC